MISTKNNFQDYIASFSKEENPVIGEMETFAKKNYIPIMNKEGMETFIGLLSLQNPFRILEIGSAIGYSAIHMALALKEAKITTIERDEERYQKACSFIAQAGLENRISIIQADALQFDTTSLSNEKFDALFIDAAKGQYKRFFEKYAPLVKSGGVIYCDNMFMHGDVLLDDKDIPKRRKTMIRNLKKFTSWVMAHPKFTTFLLPIGDGILIAIKNET